MLNFGIMRRVLGVIFLMGLSACSKKTGSGNNPPQITLISVTPEEFKSGDPDKKIVIGFKFKDLDGDIGGNPITVYQTYDSSFQSGFTLPQIPPDFIDPEKGIEGTASVILSTSFFVLDSLHQQTGDSFHFEITIADLAGNKSNTIRTPYIYIKP